MYVINEIVVTSNNEPSWNILETVLTKNNYFIVRAYKMKQRIANYVVTNNNTFICIWKLNDPFGFIEGNKKLDIFINL